MDTTAILILASSLDLDTLISLYKVSRETVHILDGKEALLSISTRYNLGLCKCFWHFVKEYVCEYPCMRSFLYLKPDKVAIMSAKALDCDMIEESFNKGASNTELTIKVAIKAALHDDKECIHPTIIRMFDNERTPHLEDAYVKYAYCYSGKPMGDYFSNIIANDCGIADIEDIIYFACRGGLFDFVKSEIEQGQISEEELSEYLDPACKGRHRKIIDYLVSKGASFGLLDFYNGDSLEATIRSGFLDLVVQAHEIKKHKDHNIKYEHYIALADRKGHTEISDYLKSCM